MLALLKRWTRPFRVCLKRTWASRSLWKDVPYCSDLRFSQFGEDALLASLLAGQKLGFYVDIGAYHPKILSNTYAFYRRGWSGINVEPNPEGFAEFKRLRRRDINLQLAISQAAGEVTFTCDGVYSGIDDEAHLFRNRVSDARKIRVPTLPLAQVLEQHLPSGQSIDFMSIDCEGHDLDVLRSNDWNRFRPKIVLVEDHPDDPQTPVDQFMNEVQYAFYCRLRPTKFFLERRPAQPQPPA